MDDFRTQLATVIDEMLAAGDAPIFLVVDLDGAQEIKAAHGAESLEKFKRAAIEQVHAMTSGADAFTYGEDTLVAILPASTFDRLKTFALIQKLRRNIPLLGQSFDAYLRPECDVLEYDAQTGAGGLINQLARRRRQPSHERDQQSA